MNIPFFGLPRQYHNLKQELLDATDKVLSSGQLVDGLYTKKFEDWLKNRCKTTHAITVHSGTQALEIIARYKKIKHQKSMAGNPKIRIPNLTYPATLNAFINAGWDVELADTDKYGILKFGYDEILSGVYDCLVGLYGMKPWDYANIKNSYGIIVDGAQHWLVCDGNVGSGMAISFDPTKNLPSSGNGGAIVTNDEQLYLYAKKFKDNDKPKFEECGTNSKMSEQDCAHILVRAQYIDIWQDRRKSINDYWCSKFKDLPITCLSDTVDPHSYHKFVVYMNDRNSLHTHLMTKGVQVKIHYDYTLGDLPVAKNLHKPDMLSKSVMLSRGVLSLPIYPELTDIEVEYITDTVLNFFG